LAKNENKFSRNFRENTKTKIFVSTLRGCSIGPGRTQQPEEGAKQGKVGKVTQPIGKKKNTSEVKRKQTKEGKQKDKGRKQKQGSLKDEVCKKTGNLGGQQGQKGKKFQGSKKTRESKRPCCQKDLVDKKTWLSKRQGNLVEFFLTFIFTIIYNFHLSRGIPATWPSYIGETVLDFLYKWICQSQQEANALDVPTLCLG
jgi:hypothetical protein